MASGRAYNALKKGIFELGISECKVALVPMPTGVEVVCVLLNDDSYLEGIFSKHSADGDLGSFLQQIADAKKLPLKRGDRIVFPQPANEKDFVLTPEQADSFAISELGDRADLAMKGIREISGLLDSGQFEAAEARAERLRNGLGDKAAGLYHLRRGDRMVKVPVAKGQLLPLMREAKHMFITGRAGTGKSTLLCEFRDSLGDCNSVTLSYTNLAALNIGGQTIHSFFKIDPNKSEAESMREEPDEPLATLLKALDIIIIDEISMVRSDLINIMDSKLRLARKSGEPFGGVRLFFFGDYFQLPPVPDELKTPTGQYAFESPVYPLIPFAILELTKSYRQQDPGFVELLDSVRQGTNLGPTLSRLNRTVVSGFRPRADGGVIVVATTNARKDEINNTVLQELPGKPMEYKPRVYGEIGKRHPIDAPIVLKRGARVIFLANNRKKGYYNGMLGEVSEMDADSITVRSGDESIVVGRERWSKVRYKVEHVRDPGTNGLVERIVPVEIASFEQFPLQLAWAVTVHKCQGQTFDKIFLDFTARRPWAHGQAYVALSRVKTFDGLMLKDRLLDSDVVIDPDVISFLKKNSLLA